jgi:hypothetical protein
MSTVRLRHLRRAGVTLLALAATACAAGVVGPLPQVADPGNAATIHVIRESTLYGVTMAFRVTLDGQEVFDIRDRQNATLQVTPGKHRVEVKCFGGLVPFVQTNGDEYEIVRDQPNYFIVSGNMITCASVRPGTPQEAHALLRDSERLELSALVK